MGELIGQLVRGDRQTCELLLCEMKARGEVAADYFCGIERSSFVNGGRIGYSGLAILQVPASC